MLELVQFFMAIAGMAIPIGLTLTIAGRIRAKNEFDILIRVMTAFGLTTAMYWLIGYHLSTAEGLDGLFHLGSVAFERQDLKDSPGSDLRTIFLLSVPSIILAISMAERGAWLTGNLVVIVVAGFVVPIILQWTWIAPNGQAGWLVARGFEDIGGAVIYFASAGFVGLATSLVIGPRVARFPLRKVETSGTSPSLSYLGLMLTTIGLALITAGRSENIAEMSGIVLNVLIGSSFAGGSALTLFVVRRERACANDLLNSCFAGSIALIAFAPSTAPASAALVGMFAGSVAIGLRNVLAAIEIDDPGDMIAICISGGVVGGIIAPVLSGSQSGALLNAVAMQLIGVFAIGLWSFLITWSVAILVHKTVGLRASEHDEARGLSRAFYNHQGEQDYLVSLLAQGSDILNEKSEDHSEIKNRISSDFSTQLVNIRSQTRQAIERIQSTAADAKIGSAMAARMRLADDGLRVNAEGVLLLLDHILSAENAKSHTSQFMTWIEQAIRVLMEPTRTDLAQFTRHLPLQAELEEVENMVIAASDTVSRCAHQLALIRDFSDAGSEGYFSRNHTCDVAELLNNQAGQLNALAEIRNIPLQIDCPVEKGLLAVGDANAFSRILMLMVEAAFNRNLHKNDAPIRLELREHILGNHVVFECLDTGLSLTGRQLRTISDPLERETALESLSLPQIMPLILAVRLVEVIGGECSLSSENGVGTLIHCRFRRVQAKHSSQPYAA